MKKRIKRYGAAALSLLLCLALLAAPVCAAAEGFACDFQTETLGEAIERYLESKGLGGTAVSIGWRDIDSGEEWYFNADMFMEGASTYKLPLAMIYADRIAAGELSLDERVGSYRLEDALRVMLEDSNNAAGQMLRDRLSTNYAEYRRILAGPSGLDPEGLPSAYYTVNSFSPRFLIGTLQTLWDGAEEYEMLIDFMKQARPDGFLCL